MSKQVEIRCWLLIALCLRLGAPIAIFVIPGTIGLKATLGVMIMILAQTVQITAQIEQCRLQQR